jgi:hypothetical protein
MRVKRPSNACKEVKLGANAGAWGSDDDDWVLLETEEQTPHARGIQARCVFLTPS